MTPPRTAATRRFALINPDGLREQIIEADSEGSAWFFAGVNLDAGKMTKAGWRMVEMPPPTLAKRVPVDPEPASWLSALALVFLFLGVMWVFSEVFLPPSDTPVSNDLTEPRVPRDPALPRKGDPAWVEGR